MRKIVSIIAGLTLSASFLAAAPGAQATLTGSEGCSHGYWKNHTESWLEDPNTPIPTTTLVKSAFNVSNTYKNATFMDALKYKGPDAEGILLRNAVAAWLNAASEDIAYPYRRDSEPFNLVAKVNAAIATGDRATMLTLEKILDKANTLGAVGKC